MPEAQKRLVTPWWYWIPVILALLYSVAGLTQLQYLSQYSDPIWTEFGYAVGQIFGAAGALGLLLRKGWARWLYVVSLIGFSVQRFWLGVLSGQLADLPSYVPFTMFMVIVVPLLLIGYATLGLRKGWIR